jgi:hypothetical protein
MLRRIDWPLALFFVLAPAATATAGAAARVDQTPAGEAADAQPPWSRGVTDETRAEAQALLDAGNELFLASKHREALDKYQAAIAVWDHPAIAFNIARALIALDRPVEAFAFVERALAYGSAPLKPSVFEEAQNYQRLLRGQIAELYIECSDPGVQVSLDGQPPQTCQGLGPIRVAAGAHQLIAERAGFLPLSRSLVALPGKTQHEAVRLLPIPTALTTEPRVAVWLPWTTLGTGAVLTGVGVALRVMAQGDIDQYGVLLARQCAATGCAPGSLPSSDLRSRADLENGLAISGLALGGTLLCTGVALWLVNWLWPVTQSGG